MNVLLLKPLIKGEKFPEKHSLGKIFHSLKWGEFIISWRRLMKIFYRKYFLETLET